MELEIKGLLRPCIVKGRKALFHRWSDKAEVIPPSPMMGGHPGGQLAQTVAIIEYDDGSVHEAYPSEVRFLDTASQMQEFEAAYDIESTKTCCNLDQDTEHMVQRIYQGVMHTIGRVPVLENNEKALRNRIMEDLATFFKGLEKEGGV